MYPGLNPSVIIVSKSSVLRPFCWTWLHKGIAVITSAINCVLSPSSPRNGGIQTVASLDEIIWKMGVIYLASPF